MKTKRSFPNQKGQALAEMILSIPILFIFAAALIQFSILFLSFIQFEHACGEGARQFAAGLCSKNSIQPIIFENLGYFKRFFDSSSLQARVVEPRDKRIGALDNLRNSAGMLPFLINYGGAEWSVSARCKPPFLFHVFFPDGILLKTTLTVDRYPK